MMESGIRHALLAPRLRLDACKRCYLPWEVLSLYMDDVLSLEEIGATPTYSFLLFSRQIAAAVCGVARSSADVIGMPYEAI